MSEEEEIIVNLKTEIEKYAAPKTHSHTYDSTLTNNNNAVTGSGIISYIQTAIQNFRTESQIQSYITEKVQDFIDESTLTTHLANYLTKSDANTTYAKANHTHNIDINMYTNPKEITTKINNVINSGYYKYVGSDATFSCMPDKVHYTNGLIHVEKQSNHIIQRVYATSYSTSAGKYKIDGRIYVRHGYTSTTSNDQVEKHWGNWYVEHIPWKERSDLLITKGTNISPNGFKIYECTAGYVFKWKQDGDDQKYILPMTQYNYSTVYTFKELPIVEPFVIGNLIGHIDIKITKNDFKVRSINKYGEHIIGVNESYFVPRTN